MKRGVWHQFGDKSQRLVEEQLSLGNGVGVILSPRDVSYPNAIKYADKYRDFAAQVVIDQQFHIPSFKNAQTSTYQLDPFRLSVSQLKQITPTELGKFQKRLEETSRELKVAAVLAPAVVYESGRPEIGQLNAQLFVAAKAVGDAIGAPTYSTVVIGRNAAAAESAIDGILSEATALNADGWYYGFEFDGERLPSSKQAVFRCLCAGMTLTCTGKPVMHAYAGPMAILSFAFGATATAIGHSQNVWRFCRERWEPPKKKGGGGGDAPSRFFSSALWGTIVYPDETVRLSATLKAKILTVSPFSKQVGSGGALGKWDANKHLVHSIGQQLAAVAKQQNPIACATSAAKILSEAATLHDAIAKAGITLKDETATYQRKWEGALGEFLSARKSDFLYLALLRQK